MWSAFRFLNASYDLLRVVEKNQPVVLRENGLLSTHFGRTRFWVQNSELPLAATSWKTGATSLGTNCIPFCIFHKDQRMALPSRILFTLFIIFLAVIFIASCQPGISAFALKKDLLLRFLRHDLFWM